jgi:hypothetical protein
MKKLIIDLDTYENEKIEIEVDAYDSGLARALEYLNETLSDLRSIKKDLEHDFNKEELKEMPEYKLVLELIQLKKSKRLK